MDKMAKTAVLILAAGEGTRMKSKKPKVLHEAAGLPLVEWVVRAAQEAVPEARPIVVYGSGGNALPEYLGERCAYVHQSERRGSGHAVMVAADMLKGYDYVAVVAGDMPLVEADSIRLLLDKAVEGKYAALLLSGKNPNPTGYGRIVRDEGGQVLRIVEERDATPEEKKIEEVNLSFYCFKTHPLLEALEHLTPDNAQGEYYLTDCIAFLHQKGLATGALVLEDASQCEGVNDRVQLAQVSKKLQERINHSLMREGVTFIDPAAAYIHPDVTVGQDTVVYPGVVIEGKSAIGEGCILYPGSRIADSQVGSGSVVQNSVLQQAVVGEDCQIGPYAFLRPGTKIGNDCRIGDFVEVKNAEILDGAKVSHLTYVGDSQVGRDVNIGCGVVFVNYDGNAKTRTVVEDGAFIGCNTNLISPVHVGKGAYIAAGSTVTRDVPEDALLIARAREVIKGGRARGRYHIKNKHGE